MKRPWPPGFFKVEFFEGDRVRVKRGNFGLMGEYRGATLGSPPMARLRDQIAESRKMSMVGTKDYIIVNRNYFLASEAILVSRKALK